VDVGIAEVGVVVERVVVETADRARHDVNTTSASSTSRAAERVRTGIRRQR
jgi:hypothetical protein